MICSANSKKYQSLAEDIATVFPNLKDQLTISVKYRDLRMAKVATIRELVSKSFRQRKCSNQTPAVPLTLKVRLTNWEGLKDSDNKSLVKQTFDDRRHFIESGSTTSQVLERYPFLRTIQGIFLEQKNLQSKKDFKYLTMRLDRLSKKHPGNI